MAFRNCTLNYDVKAAFGYTQMVTADAYGSIDKVWKAFEYVKAHENACMFATLDNEDNETLRIFRDFHAEGKPMNVTRFHGGWNQDAEQLMDARQARKALKNFLEK